MSLRKRKRKTVATRKLPEKEKKGIDKKFAQLKNDRKALETWWHEECVVFAQKGQSDENISTRYMYLFDVFKDALFFGSPDIAETPSLKLTSEYRRLNSRYKAVKQKVDESVLY